MIELEQWICDEINIIDSTALHTANCGIYAMFISPSGKEYRRDAFWNGGNNFSVRFTLPELGKWSYCVYNTNDTIEGVILCKPYSGKLDIYRHGFLKTGPQGRYLCHADNKPFFWLGDTHWHFALHEKFDESNDPRFESQFKAIVDRRVNQGFNVYQCNFHCEAAPREGTEDLYFTKQNGTLVPKITFLQNDLDKKMQYLANNGFCIAAGLSWFISAFAPDAENYYADAARYIIARYGAYPIIWTLAGEVGGYSAEMRRHCIEFWRKIAKIIEANDCYGHLQTAHYTNERPFADYYQNEDWFDFTLNQAGHGDYPIDVRPFKHHRTNYPSKPFIESESMYENVLTLEANGRRHATPFMVRRVAYTAIQAGACGYTYGAQGMWHLQWEAPAPNAPSLGFGAFDPWFVAIDFPGANQMTILKEFYESVQWHKLKPLSRHYILQGGANGYVITLNEDDLQSLFMPCCTADEDMQTIVAYYSESKTFRTRTGFKSLTCAVYTAFWFNPENGEKTIIDEHIVPDNGVWIAPYKPMDGDAILVVQEKK